MSSVSDTLPSTLSLNTAPGCKANPFSTATIVVRTRTMLSMAPQHHTLKLSRIRVPSRALVSLETATTAVEGKFPPSESS